MDDFGWTETSLAFGEEAYPNNMRFHTPNMERLAKMGVMMTNAYACSVSTPTRTCLMTGMNSAHMGITSFISLYKDTVPDAIGGHPGATNENLDDIFAHPEWNHNALCPVSLKDESEIYGLNHTFYATPLPELLRNAGYHTMHVGKAHWGPAGTPGSNPYNMGFVVNIAGSSRMRSSSLMRFSTSTLPSTSATSTSDDDRRDLTLNCIPFTTTSTLPDVSMNGFAGFLAIEAKHSPTSSTCRVSPSNDAG